MRFAVGDLPPYVVVSLRCLGGAGLLLAWTWWRPPAADTPDWAGAWIAGTLFFATGQGLLAYSQQFLPSGAAAVLLASIPLWLVALAALLERARPAWQTVLGCAVGFGGVVLLAARRIPGGLRDFAPAATAAALCSAFSWALGTQLSRRRGAGEDPVARTARQLLVGGVLALAVAVATGQLAAASRAGLDLGTAGAMAYLILGGTVLGFGAYSWLLRVVSPPVVGTYAFVNPVVALLLGWLVVSEPLTPRLLLASGVILTAVALVVLGPAQRH